MGVRYYSTIATFVDGGRVRDYYTGDQQSKISRLLRQQLLGDSDVCGQCVISDYAVYEYAWFSGSWQVGETKISAGRATMLV